MNSSPWRRWWVLGLLMALAFLCHFNRAAMPVAGTERIMDQYSISEEDMGLVYSAYLLVYTICMTPGGWLIDRFGPKAALGGMGFATAVFVIFTGVVGMVQLPTVLFLFALLAVRALLGAAQAPMYPGAARMVSFWMPLPQRPWANGVVTSFAMVGVTATFTGFGFLMDQVGWPRAFVICGIVTALAGVVWSVVARDHPAEDSASVPRGLFGFKRSSEHSTSSLAASLSLFNNPHLLLLTASYAAVGYFEYLFMYWMQYYFDKILKLGPEQSRLFSTAPNVAMFAGMIAGGWMTGALQTRFSPRLSLTLVPVCGLLASGLFAVLGVAYPNPYWAATCFSAALGAIGMTEGPFWTAAVELGGRRGGASAGIFNTGGNAGGILAPVVTPLFSKQFGWQAGFGLASAVCLGGAILWFWIDPTAKPEEDQA